MKPSLALQTHRASSKRVRFDSVLHGNDHEGSDLDILIDPTPNTILMDVAAIQPRFSISLQFLMEAISASD